jgi:uncharacterized hydrophobic protein (TIGR00271 family)
MALRISWLKTSQARNKQVIEDIEAGSEPRSIFYIMLIAASLIASLGLVANSTAVIIGAMLVSPLMTPIFGIALAMLLGDTQLFWRATAAEALGVILAVGFALLFGLLPLELEPTNEMLIRTSPNLLDLLVAVFAGAAGAFALIDERVSPALPGVAMATAIVPPLSNTGLCLALGAYEGAIGSFLLFVANFFAILVVGAGVFYAAGISRTARDRGARLVKRNLVFAAGGFLLVSLFLTQALITPAPPRFHQRHRSS